MCQILEPAAKAKIHVQKRNKDLMAAPTDGVSKPG